MATQDTQPLIGRRHFLSRASLAAAVAATGLPGTASTAVAAEVTSAGRPSRAGGRMKEVKAFAVKPPVKLRGGSLWLLLRATTEDGLVGWGECYWLPIPGDGVELAEAIAQNALVGRSPFETAGLYQAIFKFPGR